MVRKFKGGIVKTGKYAERLIKIGVKRGLGRKDALEYGIADLYARAIVRGNDAPKTERVEAED